MFIELAETPVNLTSKQKELLREFEELSSLLGFDEGVTPHRSRRAGLSQRSSEIT